MAFEPGIEPTAPLSGEPKKRRRFKRMLSAEEVGLIKRVLHYAKAYHRRIVGALIIGIVASVLTAVNLAALIPVLNVLFQTPEDRAIALAEREEDIADLKGRLEAGDEGFFKRQEIRVRLAKHDTIATWERWVTEKEEKAIYIMAGILVLAQIVKSLLDFTSKYMLQRYFFLSILRMKTELYQRCLALDMPQMSKITSGDLIARLNGDIRAVRQVFMTMVSEVVLAPFTVISLLFLLFLLNWKMTLIVFLGLPIIVLPITIIGKRLRSMGKRDEEEDAKILSLSQETLQGLPIVKAFGAEARELNRFRMLSRDMAKRQIRREKYRLYSDPFVEITASFAMAAVLCAGAYVVLKSSSASMSPIAFLMYLGILTRFYPPIKRLTNTMVKLQKALANAERVFEIIDMEPMIQEKPDAVELTAFQQDIVFESVAFSYAPGLRNILSDFNLTIPKGKKVAIVGSAGAGKSTIIRLLPRLYDVNDGRILIDGLDIRDLTLRSLREKMALVTQDPVLFNDTVFNNIAYARPDASREEVLDAAKAAYAEDFILELPQGYDTIIGERGGKLSGGQKQRLTIARALLADSPILILDEATSSLDNISESIVQRAIEKLMENRTSIVIAHRLSTVRKSDEIIVLDEGRIAERGTHDELMQRGGKYFDLVKRPDLAGV